MKHRFIEFFKSDKGNLSMTRLLCFMSWFPASFVLIKTQNENMFITYLSIFVGGYVAGKWADVQNTKNKGENVSITLTDPS